MNEFGGIAMTPWFDGETKPVRDGVYMQLSVDGKRSGFQKFAGGKWYSFHSSPASAESSRDFAAEHYQYDKWRGLAKNPK